MPDDTTQSGQMSAEQFAAKLQAKYPDYANIPTNELVSKVLAKYPQYNSLIDPRLSESTAMEAAQQQAGQQMRKGGLLPPPTFGERLERAQNPGVSEGAGLREGLAGYVGDVGTDVGQGAKDIAQGQIARGGHEIIRGAGKASLPALPFLLAGAPLATVGTAAVGSAGGAISRGVANIAGATSDQQDIISDIGSIAAGGWAGSKIPAMIPSRTRAGAALNEVMPNVAKQPVDVADAGNAALRAMEIANRGGGNVKVINDFLRRTSDPNKGPLTFDEARDFYSNAIKLTVAEQMATKGSMKAAVTKFAVSLGEALNQAAENGGKGDLYRQAMQEYANASKLGRIGEDVKDILIQKIIPYSIAGAIAKKILLK